MTQELKMSLSLATPGMTLQGVHAVITEKKVSVTKTGKPYADITIRDTSGTLKCKIWNYVDQDFIEVGKVILIGGEVSAYQGENQCVLSSYVPSSKNPSEFFKRSRHDIHQMKAEIGFYINDMEEPLTKYITSRLWKAFEYQLGIAPAATGVHNAWVGGLLEHIWSMCNMARPFILNYKQNYEAPISEDKVYFGIILHDIGKIFEYDSSNPAYPHTANGVLVNHLVTGPSMVYQASTDYFRDNSAVSAEEFAKEQAHLMHIIAAHHGKIEWGSPVVPSTLEAIIVHQLDMIDTRMMHAIELIEGKEGPIKGFSEKSWVEKTSYLRG